MADQNTSDDNSNTNERTKDNASKTMPRDDDAMTETTRTIEKQTQSDANGNTRNQRKRAPYRNNIP